METKHDLSFCPACGHKLTGDEIICPFCGYRLIESEIKTEKAPPVTDVPDKPIPFSETSDRPELQKELCCPTCKTKLNGDEIMCPFCGLRIKQDEKDSAPPSSDEKTIETLTPQVKDEAPVVKEIIPENKEKTIEAPTIIENKVPSESSVIDKKTDVKEEHVTKHDVINQQIPASEPPAKKRKKRTALIIILVLIFLIVCGAVVTGYLQYTGTIKIYFLNNIIPSKFKEETVVTAAVKNYYFCYGTATIKEQKHVVFSNVFFRDKPNNSQTTVNTEFKNIIMSKYPKDYILFKSLVCEKYSTFEAATKAGDLIKSGYLKKHFLVRFVIL